MAEGLRWVRCAYCMVLFFLCRSCDRGQGYCGLRCRVQGRRRGLRAANARHQRSPEGRMDHRDRQRGYRARRRARVTDQGSAPAAATFTVLPFTESPGPIVGVCGLGGGRSEDDERDYVDPGTDVRGDAVAGDGAPTGDCPGGTGATEPEPLAGSTDVFGGTRPLVPAARTRCAVCGRVEPWVDVGSTRRLRVRRSAIALRG
jgi:hypothetical protein